MAPPVRSTSSRGELPPIQVTFYRRMKMQRVYPVVVRWRKGDLPTTNAKVSLRLSLAGGQVTPNEQTLATKPDAEATFYVTPLARGWLKSQKIDILLDGRKVQELTFDSKAVTHRMTWLFLLMALMAPWLVQTLLVQSPFLTKEVYDNATNTKVTRVNIEMEKSIDKAIADNVPELPEFAEEYVGDPLRTARTESANFIAMMINAAQKEPYTFYAVAIFLALALAAAFVHRDVRRKRIGKPIAVSRASVVADDEDE